jgi:TonB family protein
LTIHILSLVLSAAAGLQGSVVPIKLSQPIYPPIAVSARVSGEVEVKIGVRPDGSVDRATVVSGPPLLQQAAVEAAQKSQFECRGCSEAATPYSLVFAFQLDGATHSAAEDEQRGAVSATPSQSRVTIVAESPVLYGDGGTYDASGTRVRSAKCLWLWKCARVRFTYE